MYAYIYVYLYVYVYDSTVYTIRALILGMVPNRVP